MNIVIFGSNSDTIDFLFKSHFYSLASHNFLLVSNSPVSKITSSNRVCYMPFESPSLRESIISFSPSLILFLSSPFHPRLSSTKFVEVYDGFITKIFSFFLELFPHINFDRFFYFSSYHAIKNSIVVDNSFHTPYSSEKVTLESFFASASSFYNFGFTSLRLTNIVNPISLKTDFGVFQVFSRLIKNYRETEVKLIDQYLAKDYIHIRDVSQLISNIIDNDFKEWPSSLDVGSGQQISPNEIFESLLSLRDGKTIRHTYSSSYVDVGPLGKFLDINSLTSISIMLSDSYNHA